MGKICYISNFHGLQLGGMPFLSHSEQLILMLENVGPYNLQTREQGLGQLNHKLPLINLGEVGERARQLKH